MIGGKFGKQESLQIIAHSMEQVVKELHAMNNKLENIETLLDERLPKPEEKDGITWVAGEPVNRPNKS